MGGLAIDRSCILLDLVARGKQEALAELVRAADRCLPEGQSPGQETLLRILLEREQLGSTGVGNGVAIPHGKVEGLRQIVLCFGRSRDGVPFEAVDNRPVHLLVMILSPLEMAEEYLRTLAAVSRLLKQEKNRDALAAASDPEIVASLFTFQE